MKYIYKMSREKYWRTVADAKDAHMTVEEYVTATFGLLGECIKVEIG